MLLWFSITEFELQASHKRPGDCQVIQMPSSAILMSVRLTLSIDVRSFWETTVHVVDASKASGPRSRICRAFRAG